MKRSVFFLMTLALAMVLPQAAQAYDFSKYNSTGQLLFYTITGTNTVKVTYPGSSTSNPYENAVKPANSMTIPESVTNNGITYTVNEIDTYAFYRCSNLTYVYIPNTVTTIGQMAFYYCSGITSIRLSENLTVIPNYAFYYCSALMGYLSLPSSVTFIGYCAFAGCSTLGGVGIPANVTYIHMNAFSNCTSLTTVNFDATNCTYMGGLSNNGSVITAFSGCTNLHTIHINQGVQNIPAYAFYGCTSWTENALSLPNSLTSIGDYAFYGCSGLSGYLVLPGWLTSIGAHAFEGCTGLTNNLYIPNSVTTIGAGAFKNCAGFNGTLHLPTNLTVIPEEAFYDLYQVTGTLTLPNNVTSIGASAFYNCRSFSGTLTIPASVTAIGNYAFGLCTSFTGLAFDTRTANQPLTIDAWAFGHCIGLNGSLTLPEGLTYIGDYAFYNCSGLNGTLTLTIPSTVTTIEGGAFSNCAHLKRIVYNAANCTTMGTEDYPVFEDCSGVSELTIGEDVSYIKKSAFIGLSSLDTVNFNAVNCTSMGTYSSPVFEQNSVAKLEIGPYVTRIPDYAFMNSSLVGNLSIPYNVLYIGNRAFYNCAYLTSVSMPYFVKTIDNHAFESCQALTSVTLPETIESLGECAFFNCTALTSVTVYNPIPPSRGYQAFTLCPNNMTVTIPCGSLAAYQQAWGSSYNYVSGSGYNTEIVTACDSYTWPINGQTYYETRDEEYPITSRTFNAEENCWHTDYLILFIEQGEHSYTAVTSCGPYTWDVDGRTYKQSGLKTYRSASPTGGCPSRDSLMLTVLNNRGTNVAVSNCGPYTWDKNGQTYTKSGNKYYRGPNEDGCVVRDTLVLTILNNRGTHEYVRNCGPYTWEKNGQTYTKNGDKFYRGANEDGCVVRDTVTLTILNNRGTHEYVSNCGPYTWDKNGQTYTKNGDKFYRGANADGCVVRDTITLTILNNRGTHEYVRNCGPYTWERSGQTYNRSGDKFYRGANEDGCVVRDTLSLTILNCDNSPETTIQKSQFTIHNLTIYPNPTTGLVHIDVQSNSQFSILNSQLSIEVMDLVGRRVAVFDNTANLDLSGLAAGTYTLRITMPEGVAIKKVVKK